ncbi:toprim domain-containing protein [Chitinophaga horti]|uniref:Toprim domain-containing protein n=1 Tax=Chitinophaga horti TaxID=2920382 RepID=A0ABY6J1E8_9BACT|nr:toprim domain-containing protein [Chitinophaga horti]UYQ92186.1 toprim domain-containing protein [Chitinophaga horti]
MEEKSVPEILQEIKEMDIVAYLSACGIQPTNIRGKVYMYISPIRDRENTPSFKVDAAENAWYDHGTKAGGNLVDLMLQLHQWTIADVLRWYRNNKHIATLPKRADISPRQQETKVKIIRDEAIVHPALLNYLTQRAIDHDIAKRYCRQVHYEIYGKSYFGIGLKNNSGQWAIRNEFMKSASSPADFTSIDNGSNTVHIFEGMFDFLSFVTFHWNMPVLKDNFCILNTTGMFEKARQFMDKHSCKLLYLDNGTGGRNVTTNALKLNLGYQDKSIIYKNHDDLNDWHRSLAKRYPPPKKGLRQ